MIKLDWTFKNSLIKDIVFVRTIFFNEILLITEKLREKAYKQTHVLGWYFRSSRWNEFIDCVKDLIMLYCKHFFRGWPIYMAHLSPHMDTWTPTHAWSTRDSHWRYLITACRFFADPQTSSRHESAIKTRDRMNYCCGGLLNCYAKLCLQKVHRYLIYIETLLSVYVFCWCIWFHQILLSVITV